MSLTVTCTSCRDPEHPRRIVQFRQNCRDCADDLIARHKLEYPDHVMELTGRVSDTPLGDVPQRIERLFGRKTA